MKRAIQTTVLSTLLVLLAGCGKQEGAVTLKVYHGGNEYLILDRGDISWGEEQAYYVRYRAEDPSDKVILEAECADLYAIISKHIDTNRHQRVIVDAVGSKGRFFGLLGAPEAKVVITVEEVMTYKPDELNPSPEVP